MVEDAAATARVGSVLNEKWALEKLLGVGGMGAVYAARHTRNGARAAVKILHPELARIVEVRERFLQEGRAANAVQHPGVVKVIDDDQVTSGPDAGTTYLVMELLDGESLEDRIERAPKVSERELLGIADAVLDVLAAAHARGVVHRDLKPENLFFAKDAATGRARWMVLDFGLARLLDATVITRYGIAVGTPAYMSPEQAAGRRDEIDGRTDIFALAATAFRVLTGRRIHEGGTPVEVVLKMASAPAPPIRDVAPQVSEPVAKVIDRALAFRREDRFPDAAAMRAGVLQAIAALDASTLLKTVVDPRLPTSDEPATLVVTPGPPPDPVARAERTVELSASDLEPARVVGEGAHPRDPAPEPRTVEISARDFEPPSRADLAPPMRALAPTEPQLSRRPKGARDASLPSARPRRPSLIPVVTALFLGGLVVKLALDAEEAKRTGYGTIDLEAGTTPSELGSGSAPLEPLAPGYAELEDALASVTFDAAGYEGDARDAQGGNEDALGSFGASAQRMDGRTDAGVAERIAVDSGQRGANDRHPPPSPLSASPAHAMAPPPLRRPVHPKPHPKRGE